MEIYNQPSFNKGMVTVRQKNASDLSNAYDFVTWCENFTPNKIIGSLIRRSGVDGFSYYFADKSNTSSFNVFLNNGILSQYSNPNIGGVLNLSALSGDIESSFGTDNLIGFFELSTSRPLATQIPIVMFKDENDSYIASYYIRRSGTDYYSQWNETYNMPNLEMLDEHKNRIHGIISDYDNIGEVLLFVSKKDSVTDYSYPIYVYAYNDGRRYVEHWMKPDNNPPDTGNEYWHVRKNSQAYTSDVGMLVIEPMNKLIFKYDVNQMFETLIGNNFSSPWRTRWIDMYNSGYMVEQSNVPENNTAFTRTAALTTDILRNTVEVVFFQSGNKPYGSNNSISYNSEDDFWYTVEELKGVDWLPYENTMGYQRNKAQTEDMWHGHCKSNFFYRNFYSNNTNYIAVPVKPIAVNYKGSVDDNLQINSYVLRSWACNQNGSSRYYDVDNMPLFQDEFPKLTPPICFHAEDALVQTNYNEMIVRVMLPKYLGNNVPRPYLAGEEIPFVLTAVINGTETEMYRDKYIVKEANPRKLDPSIVDSSFMVSPDSKIRLFQQTPTDPSKPLRKFKEEFTPDELCWSNVRRTRDWGEYGTGLHDNVATWVPEPSEYHDTNNQFYAQGLRGQRVLMPIDTINGKVVNAFEESGKQWKATVNDKEVFFQNYDATPEAGYIYFTIRINAASYADALTKLPDGLTEFKLYFAEGDATKGLVKYDDQGRVWNYSTQGYMSHRATAEDSKNYRLIKRFIVSNSKGIEDVQYGSINQATQGLSGFEATNSWICLNSEFGIGSGIYAVPNHWRDKLEFDQIPHSFTDYNENRLLNFHNLNIPETYNQNITDDYFKDLLFGNINGFSGSQYSLPMNQWSSDFCLWDYPTTSTLLNQNISDENWDGVGAGLVCNVNGIIVIGDLQDKELQPEDGIIRFTSIKNNVVLTDVFPAQNKFRIGKERHTALINWREQLIAFYDSGFYKVMVRGIDPANWIIADKFVGQGVSKKKHIAVTPQGIIFMNGNGIFVTDGSTIQDISTPINNIYKMFISESKHGTSILSPYTFSATQNSYIKSIGNGLDESELVYDNVNNDLIVVIKSGGSICELVFNLNEKNWVIRSHGKPIDTDNSNTSYSYKTLLRSHFCGSNGLIWINKANVYSNDPWNQCTWLHFNKYLDNSEVDTYRPLILKDSYVGNYNRMEYNFKDDNLVPRYFPIWGSIITDTIGDGINDHNAFKLELAGIPTQLNIQSDIGASERFYLINRTNMDYRGNNHHNFVDLFTLNFRSSWKRWLLKNSPSNTAPAVTGIINPTSRESYVYNIPHGQMFRRCQLYYEGYELYYLENLIMMYNKQIRRWG